VVGRGTEPHAAVAVRAELGAGLIGGQKQVEVGVANVVAVGGEGIGDAGLVVPDGGHDVLPVVHRDGDIQAVLFQQVGADGGAGGDRHAQGKAVDALVSAAVGERSEERRGGGGYGRGGAWMAEK